MPTPEARYERANRITVQAIRIARQAGETFAETVRIYDREIERLIGEEPAYRDPPASDAQPQPRAAVSVLDRAPLRSNAGR